MSKDIQRYSDMMEHEFPKQFAFAVSDTLNKLARESKNDFREKIADRVFDRKNSYIKRVVEDQRTQTRDVDSMHSAFGELTKLFGRKTTTQLKVHETGGVLKPERRRKRLHDGTKAGRGGSFRKPLRKIIAESKVKTIRDLKPGANKGFFPNTDKGKTIGLIIWAKRERYRGLLAIRSPKKDKLGQYRVTGAKNKLKLTMVKSLEKRTRVVSAKNWMERSYYRPMIERRDYYEKFMNKQIDYLKNKNFL